MSDGARPEHRALPGLSGLEQSALGRLGEYQLLEVLGQGGMGVVYRAWHTELDRVVALKVLAGIHAGNEQMIARFKREMRAVGQLEHANIVRAHDARQIEGTYVLVMEFVDGLDLGELVERLGPQPIADACELVRQAALGLQHAHEHGLVHRDIKPSNLMLCAGGSPEPGRQDEVREDGHPDAAGEPRIVTSLVKILDLGLARFQAGWVGDEQMTAIGQLVGTPDYMAPEQATDSSTVDHRADQYSLGCTLYCLLAGRAPFGGSEHPSAMSKIAAHLGAPIPPIQEYRAAVPDDLAAVLDRMLAKTPQQRFSDAGEVAEALLPFTPGCALSQLLAAAERVPKSRQKKTPPIAPPQQQPTAMLTRTRHDRVPRPSFPVAARARRRPWLLAGTVGLLAIGLLLATLLVPRLFQDNIGANGDGGSHQSAMSRMENGKSPPAPNPDRPGPPVATAGRSRWVEQLVLSRNLSKIGKPDIWLFRPRSGESRRVTSSSGSFDYQPQFSPSGRHIVFLRSQSLYTQTELWICESNGSHAHRLVAPRGRFDLLLSAVWVSDSRIYFARVSKDNRLSDVTIWQVDVEMPEPRPVFGFRNALGQDGGMVTDVSPDGRQLLIVARRPSSAVTADVYSTDLDGNAVQVVWEDPDDDHRDSRAIWSPDGKRIAWQHGFEQGFGIGIARLGSDGHWTPRLQREEAIPIVPVAWRPDGRYLLCARLRRGAGKAVHATLFLMDDRFETVRELFDVDPWWQPHSGRIADWAMIPADAFAPPGGRPGPDLRRRRLP